MQKSRFGRNLNPDRRRRSSIIYIRSYYQDLCDSISFRVQLNDFLFANLSKNMYNQFLCEFNKSGERSGIESKVVVKARPDRKRRRRGFPAVASPVIIVDEDEGFVRLYMVVRRSRLSIFYSSRCLRLCMLLSPGRKGYASLYFFGICFYCLEHCIWLSSEQQNYFFERFIACEYRVLRIN